MANFSVMADVPNPVFDSNGDPFSGAVLKAFLPGGTTSTSIAIDSAGSSPQTSITYNAQGKLEVSGNEILPYIDRKHKWGIFANAADATANTPFYMGPFDAVFPVLDSNESVVKNFLTLALAISDTGLADGDTVKVGDRGSSTWNVVLLSTVTPSAGEPAVANIVTSTGVPTLALVAILSWSIDIRIIGAIGGNAATDTAALNLALTLGRDVTIPTIASAYIFANIQLPRGSWLQGNQKYDGGAGTTSTFIGDGTNPVFLCGDGGTTALREHTFTALNGDGNTREVILGRTAPNLTIKDCFFKTTSATKNTIDLDLCARSQIERSRISSSGGGFALQAYNNCNGSGFNKLIITGGELGGAINVGLISAVQMNNNTIETSLIGIQVAANSDTGNGNANGVTMNGNHIENCSVPFSFGTQFSVFGLKGSANFVGNTNLTLTPAYIVEWGRVFDSSFAHNTYHVNTSESVYNLRLKQATGDQVDNVLGLDNIFGTPANLFILTGAFGASGSVQRTVGHQNHYPFISSLSKSDTVVFESATITANVGIVNLAFNNIAPLVLGGKVTKVEVFEKQGTITSTLTVGRAASSAELVNVNPEALSFTDGRADATLLTATATVRSDESATYRVIAGVGTGTFRVRITYRVS